MAQLSVLRTDLQTRFVDTSGRYLTDAMSNTFLNVANREFCNRTECLNREYGWVAVANQFLYTLPTDIIRPGQMFWMQSSRYPLEYRPIQHFAKYGGLDLDDKSHPHSFTLHDQKLRLWPTPSTASASTTMNDAGGINTTDTSVILTSAASFRDQGWISIESELILYYAKSTNTLSQLVRGVGGTTAATHADTTAVSQVDLHMFYSHVDATLSADADTPAMPAQFHDILVLGALFRALRADGRDQESELVRREWEGELALAKGHFQELQKSNFVSIQLDPGYE